MNSVQEAVFNGTQKEKARSGTGPSLKKIYSKLYKHSYEGEDGIPTTRTYRFFAQARSSEEVIGWNKPDKSNIQFDAANRRPGDYNLLLFTVEDVRHSEKAYVQATALFIGEKVPVMKYTLVGIAVTTLVALTLTTLSIVKVIVVLPVEHLSN